MKFDLKTVHVIYFISKVNHNHNERPTLKIKFVTEEIALYYITQEEGLKE